jgi:hypothetical protein
MIGKPDGDTCERDDMRESSCRGVAVVTSADRSIRKA